jgi:hypothetical protein
MSKSEMILEMDLTVRQGIELAQLLRFCSEKLELSEEMQAVALGIATAIERDLKNDPVLEMAAAIEQSMKNKGDQLIEQFGALEIGEGAITGVDVGVEGKGEGKRQKAEGKGEGKRQEAEGGTEARPYLEIGNRRGYLTLELAQSLGLALLKATVHCELLKDERYKSFVGERQEGVFTPGQELNCRICGKSERLGKSPSGWRCIEIDGVENFICKEHFPPDGSSDDEYRAAYQRVMMKIANKSKGFSA